MIDTDKYEGHTKGPWVVLDGALWRKHANGNLYSMFELEPVPLKEEIDPQLMADAPLLLEEVKRLREQVECSKDGHEWELDDYLDGDPNEPIRIVETCAACGLVRERIE